MRLTEQTDHPRLTVFRKCWVSCNSELFFRNMGQEEGEAAGRLCDYSSFISMLVYFAVLPLFLSFSLCFFVCSFSFSSPFKRTTLIWMGYRVTLSVCVCIRLFNVHLLCDHFCADREKFKRPLQ